MKNVAIIYSSYDGIVNSYCGVGTATRTFIKSFPQVRDFLSKFDLKLSLHLITPALVPESLGYNEKIYKESSNITKGSGGDIHFVTNGSNGMIPYGDSRNWLAVSHTTASKVLEISRNYDKVIFFAVDTPFAQAPYFVELQKEGFGVKNIISVLVLHSDVLIHQPDDPPIDRLGWEASAIKNACLSENVKIAITSKFVYKHLEKNYGVPKKCFVEMQTGICPESERYKFSSQEEIINGLKKYKIPLDKNLIFSVGRAEEYKGFDILIKAIAKINMPAHLVFIASPYKTENSIVPKLQALLKTSNISTTPIFNLDFNLPRLICQWEKTRLVAQLSRREPFGLVPEEVRIWAQKTGPVVLASKRDGFIEQITDGVDGFLVDIDDTKTVTKKIDEILSRSEPELSKIRRKGLERALRNYDFRLSLFRCLKTLVKFSAKEEEFLSSIK